MIVLGVLAFPLIAVPLIASDPLAPADAIVVIGGDHKPDRIAHAVRLYEDGYAPVIILSAGTLVWEGNERVAEAEVMRRQAIALGVPPEVMILEVESRSTYENAHFTRQLSEAHRIDSLLLVTSTYHSRRARHFFREVFPPDSQITFSTQPAPLPVCSQCWIFYPDYVHTVFYEYYNWALWALGLYPSHGSLTSPMDLPS